MINWLKYKLRKWLGVENNEDHIDVLDKLYSDLVTIGVDVNCKESHMIFIYSKLKGGQIHSIPAHFGSLKELNEFVRWLKKKYRTEKEVWDLPSHLPDHYRRKIW